MIGLPHLEPVKSGRARAVNGSCRGSGRTWRGQQATRPGRRDEQREFVSAQGWAKRSCRTQMVAGCRWRRFAGWAPSA